MQVEGARLLPVLVCMYPLHKVEGYVLLLVLVRMYPVRTGELKRVLIINKDVRKSLAHKKGNEVLIWSWNKSVPRLLIKDIQNIKEAQEAAPNLFQATPLIVCHPDAPSFSQSILTRGAKWPALLTCANTTHTTPALTETADPNTVTLAASGNCKRNSNFS